VNRCSGSQVPPSTPRHRLWSMVTLVAVLATGLVAAGCTVTPSVTFQHSTFEGFPVISYVPEHPRGMVYVFHGSNGSAGFAERVETVDVLNMLIARGYGFVSTSSTERTGDKRWDVFNTSLQSNPDLARLGRLQANLVATTPLEAGTPLVGIGMSNGARFVTLWGQSWKVAGYPVKAIWASHGNAAPSVEGAGKLTVPTVFSTASHDFTVPPLQVIADYNTAHDSGTPSELYISQERRLNTDQYLRIPGIDSGEAKAIFNALVATGVWNAQGDRIVSDIQQATTRAAAASFPASVDPQRNEIVNETALILAVHQFTAEFGGRATAFFDRYVPAG
jgi:hypothetical protein